MRGWYRRSTSWPSTDQDSDGPSSSILLVAGDKSGRWKTWYQEAIPVAEHRYELYLKDRAREEGKA